MKLIEACLLTMNRDTLILAVFCILYFAGLSILYSVLKKKEKSLMLYQVFSLIPLIFCMIHFAGNSFQGNIGYSLKIYLPMYAGAIFMAGCPLLLRWEKICKGVRIATGFVTVIGVLMSLICLLVTDGLIVIGNASRANYIESFEIVMAEMQEHYVLNEWKEIDYDRIRKEIMPKIEKAQEDQDPVAYCIALQEYVNMFHDDHIWLTAFQKEGSLLKSEAVKTMAGNDYGFSLFTIDTGETIAVLVEEGSEAWQQGIRNGTIVTGWNGVDIEEAIENADYTLGASEPVKANQDMLNPIYFAGMGEQSVDVSFISDGKEKTITIKSIGNYEKRMNYALECINHQYHFDTEKLQDASEEELEAAMNELQSANENFRTKMISEDCGYIVINSEECDVYKDTLAEIKGEYPEIRELVDQKLTELQEQGMTKLVIDARNNGGGYPIILCEIASLFATEEIDMGYEQYIINGKRQESTHYLVKANGKWANLSAAVLTNNACGSSGDGLVYALSQCPNVTTMGITCSEGIYQSTGGICVMSDSLFCIGYPVFSSVEADEITPMIDTAADRRSRVPLDVTIPVTYDAAIQIFGDNEEDYELQQAVIYLEEQECNEVTVGKYPVDEGYRYGFHCGYKK